MEKVKGLGRIYRSQLRLNKYHAVLFFTSSTRGCCTSGTKKPQFHETECPNFANANDLGRFGEKLRLSDTIYRNLQWHVTCGFKSNTEERTERRRWVDFYALLDEDPRTIKSYCRNLRFHMNDHHGRSATQTLGNDISAPASSGRERYYCVRVLDAFCYGREPCRSLGRPDAASARCDQFVGADK